MNLDKTLNKLCSPARFYLGVSVFFILLLLVQNIMNGVSNELCVGTYKCNIPHTALFFIVKTLYVLFWTWVLNLLCKYGLKKLSWFIVLIPFLLFAVALGMFFYVALTQAQTQTQTPTQRQRQM